MTDVATLGVTATETGVSKVDKALMGLAASAGKAEAATGRFTSASSKATEMQNKVNSMFAKSPIRDRASDVAEYARQMDNLRAKYNPLFAASKQYESELNGIIAAERIGAISARESADAQLRLSKAFAVTSGQVESLGNSLKRVHGISQGTAGGFQNFGYQIQDFAVQVGAGTSATQALGQQLPQLLSGFGLLGIALGTAAAVLIPLAGYYFGAAEKATLLADATRDLTEATAAYNIQSGAITLGVDAEEVVHVRELNRLMAELASINSEWQATDSLGARQRLAEEAQGIKLNISLVQGQVDAYRAARDELIRAKENADNVAKSVGDIVGSAVSAKSALESMLASAPSGGWLSGAIGDASVLAAKLWDAASANAALAQRSIDQTPGNLALAKYGGRGVTSSRPVTDGATGLSVAFGVAGAGASGASVGAGGGGTDPYQSNLDALMKSLMTERETVEKWYADNEVILNDRRAMELLGAAGHKEAMLDLERQYHEKLSKIKDDSDAYNLGSTAKLFGDLNTMAGGGYEGLLRAQKAFAAAEALVNTYRGAAQELARPTATPWQKFAAVAKVIATGMGLVNAIKGGGKAGAGGSGGSSAQTTAASSQPVADRVTTVSFAGDPFMVAIAESVMKQMYDASGNGRVLIKA